MGAEAARAPWHDAAASQSIPVQGSAPSPRHTAVLQKIIYALLRSKRVISDWYFNPQAACGGRKHHQQASRNLAPLHMQKDFLVH